MRHATRAVLSAVTLAIAVLLGAGPAAATPGGHPAVAPADDLGAAPASTTGYAWGFAYAHQPTITTPYQAHSRMSATSSGLPVTVDRSNTGIYAVTMPGLGPAEGGNVQVTAYGSGTTHCKYVDTTRSGSDLIIIVQCRDGDMWADSEFLVQYLSGSNTPGYQSAYLTYRLGTVTDSYHSYGATNTVTRIGTGIWRVDFGSGFTRLGGIVHVTAVGWGVEFCKVRSWGADQAEVRCYTSYGTPVDTDWSLRYQDRQLPNGSGDAGGYLWANQPDHPVGSSYHPDGRHSYNTSGAANEVIRQGTGVYRVKFPGVPAVDAGNPMVTGHWLDGVRCQPTGLFSSGSSSIVYVECRDTSGDLVNASFTVSQVTNR